MMHFKRIPYVVLSLLILLSGCSTNSNSQSPSPTQLVSPVPTFISTSTPVISSTNTHITPTNTPIPVRQSNAREQIRQILTEYGHVDDKYLTDIYWHKLDNDIDKFGKANRVLVLEYHGDNYSMYDGYYAMTPESFTRDMQYLMANNYHFVTGAEMSGFISGWLDLPSHSIFLSTDSGSGSTESMTRIISLFADLESQYGYTPHMNSYIWTMNLDETESIDCQHDSCWSLFRQVRDSGYFTIGSHTESHADFSTLNQRQTNYDLNLSLNDIKTNLDLTVYAIAWPFEACSPYDDALIQLGIKYAFGGSTRNPSQLYTYQNDNMALCLPRLFPPNPNGRSGRPSGLTFEQMLEQTRENKPLK